MSGFTQKLGDTWAVELSETNTLPETSCWVSPNSEAMTRSKKVGLARFVMRTKQYLAALRAKDGVLVLSTMLYDDEVTPLDKIEGVPEGVELSDREVAMAEQLVQSLATEFEPAKYHDEYRQRVLDLIQAKAERQVIAAPPVTEPATPVVDLMAALEASLAAAKAKSSDGKGKAKERQKESA